MFGSLFFAGLALWTDWPGYLLVLEPCRRLYLLGSTTAALSGLDLLGLVAFGGTLFSPPDSQRQRRGLVGPLECVTDAPGKCHSHKHCTDRRQCSAIHRVGLVQDSRGRSPRKLSGVDVASGGRGHRARILAHVAERVGGGIDRVGLRPSHGRRSAFMSSSLRNESFIHDFALLLPRRRAVAMAAGPGWTRSALAAERASRGLSALFAGYASSPSAASFLCSPPFSASTASRKTYVPAYLILDGTHREPPQLIPALGHAIDRAFPAGATLLANFDPYGSAPLTYYAQHIRSSAICSSLEIGTR